MLRPVFGAHGLPRGTRRRNATGIGTVNSQPRVSLASRQCVTACHSIFFFAPQNIDTGRLAALLIHAHYLHHVVAVLDRWTVHRCAIVYFEKYHPD